MLKHEVPMHSDHLVNCMHDLYDEYPMVKVMKVISNIRFLRGTWESFLYAI